jgi:hypothetical protein
MLIQYLLIFLVLLMIVRVTRKWKQGLLGLRDLFFWVAFWIAAGIIVVLPEVTNFFARLFGIGRGADLVIYLSIVLIFYIIFQIMVRIEKIERNITKIVREMALGQENLSSQSLSKQNLSGQEEAQKQESKSR